MSKFEDQIDPDDAICPYCDAKYQVEAEDYSEDERKETCDSCGKKYWVSQQFSIDNITRPDCEANDEKHDYERITLSNGKIADFCADCGDCRLVSV